MIAPRGNWGTECSELPLAQIEGGDYAYDYYPIGRPW